MDFLSSPWLIGPIAVVSVAALYVLAVADGVGRATRTAARWVVYGLVVVVSVLIVVRFQHLALTPTARRRP